MQPLNYAHHASKIYEVNRHHNLVMCNTENNKAKLSADLYKNDIAIVILCIDQGNKDCIKNLKQYYQDIQSQFRNDGLILVACVGKPTPHVDEIALFCSEKKIDSPFWHSAPYSVFGSSTYHGELKCKLDDMVNAYYAKKQVVNDRINAFFSSKKPFTVDCLNDIINAAKKSYCEAHWQPNFILDNHLESKYPISPVSMQEIKFKETCFRLLLNILIVEGDKHIKSFKYLVVEHALALKADGLHAVSDNESTAIVSAFMKQLKSCMQFECAKKMTIFSFWANQKGIPIELTSAINKNLFLAYVSEANEVQNNADYKNSIAKSLK
jgi:hypothetical protein